MTFHFEEKDSCGVGFIASRGIPRTHGMTLKILECLSNLDQEVLSLRMEPEMELEYLQRFLSS